MNCGGNGDPISRHNAIRDVIFRVPQGAALAPSRETPNCVLNSLVRSADIFLPNWSCDRPAVFNVHIISPRQQQTLEEAASNPSHTLQVGVKRKLFSHLSACRSARLDFISLVAETLGGLAKDTIYTIRSIGQAIRQKAASSDPFNCTRHLFLLDAISL